MDGSDEEKLILIVSTFPTAEDAERICVEAVEKKYAACANLLKVRSFFTWEEKLERAEEALALIKTSKTSYKDLMRFIKDQHPYSVPEILALDVSDVNKGYLDWVVASTRRGSPSPKKRQENQGS